MAVKVTKELALVEDIEFGFGASLQARTGNKFNAAYLPYTVGSSVEDALNDRYTSAYIDATFAPIAGNSLQLFEVADGTTGFQAVNFSQLDLKADKTVVDLKADKSNVLELDNNNAYSPLFAYNPATKQYVDDSIFTAFQTGVSGSFTSQDGKLITVTGGLITGII